MALLLPSAHASLVGADGLATRPFYTWMRNVNLSLGAAGSRDYVDAEIKAVAVRLGSKDGSIAGIPASGAAGYAVNGNASIMVSGTPAVGYVNLSLMGDTLYPASTWYYGSDSSGSRGWYAISDTLAGSDTVDKSVDANGVTSFALPDVGNTATGTFQAITVDSKGRVTGTRGATITGTAGRITVAHGDASDGLPTIDLAEVTDAGGGTLQRTVFDAYGRKTGTSAATTSDLVEGDNLYYTDARADERITIQKAQPDGLATLDDSGKLDAGQLPALAITSTFVVADEASMLALDCQQGDVAVRTDLSKSFILTAEPPSTLANWQELLVPTAGVTSFNGRTGSVTPASGDYTFAQIASTPTTLAGYGITDAATSAQGAKADSAVQPGDLGTAATHAATDFDAAGDAAAAQAAAEAYANSLVAALPQGAPYVVADGNTYHVAAGMQALWSIPIDLEGDASLDIEGALVEVE